MLALLVAFGALGAQQTETAENVSSPPVAVVAPFETPFVVAQPIRLARTPVLDGTIAVEEWEELATLGDAPLYLQWEPGVLYLAGRAPVGEDLVWSLDLRGDGWLVGSDNVEIRVETGTGRASARRLDASDRNGPRWMAVGLPEGAMRIETKDGVVEMKLLGLRLAGFGAGDRIGVRADAVAATAPAVEPFRPRQTALLTLALDQTERLPADVMWRSDFLTRSVAVGETIDFRLIWEGEGARKFRRVQLRPEGPPPQTLAESAEPFPALDRRGRASVRYRTVIPAGAAPGFRVLRATLTDDEGNERVLRTSFRVAEAIVFDVNLPGDLRSSAQAQIVRGAVTLRSQSMRRLDGTFSLVVPEGWTVARGTDRRFTIYHARGGFRVPLELVAPAGAKGLAPLRYRAEVGSRVIEQVVYLEIAEQVLQPGG
jgi:hypothetical protein